MKWLGKIKSKLLTSDLEDTNPSNGSDVTFELWYDKILVGHLSFEEHLWNFWYSQQFKNQDVIDPLVEFPNTNKVYTSNELWPFFVVRIPSLTQPRTQKIIKKDNIDSSSQIDLLKRFGYETIANPFLLKAN